MGCVGGERGREAKGEGVHAARNEDLGAKVWTLGRCDLGALRC